MIMMIMMMMMMTTVVVVVMTIISVMMIKMPASLRTMCVCVLRSFWPHHYEAIDGHNRARETNKQKEAILSWLASIQVYHCCCNWTHWSLTPHSQCARVNHMQMRLVRGFYLLCVCVCCSC